MAEVSTARVPLTQVKVNNSSSKISDDELTVEEYLTMHCDKIIDNLRSHGDKLVFKLRSELDSEVQKIQEIMKTSASKTKLLICTVKCTAGPHIGQKFRLEPKTESGDDVFKIGRSTGKLFKEKGVSMYKDKEVSTTHGKIETRNGHVFFTDVRSTNGTSINGNDLEEQIPIRLHDGDVIRIGSSELTIKIDSIEEDVSKLDVVSL